MRMRVQVNLSDEMVTRVDNLAKAYGMSRSGLCAYLIGSQVNANETALDLIEDAKGGIKEKLIQEIQKELNQ